MLDALVGGVRVVADGGADAADLVGGDARAHAGAADQHAPLDLTVAHRVAEPLGEVRVVVVRVRAVAAEVLHVMTQAGRLEPAQQRVLERRTGVIGGEGDPHQL